MRDNWLITGGMGFLGMSLIRELLDQSSDINIRVLDNLSVGKREDLAAICDFIEIQDSDISGHPNGIEFFKGDVIDIKTCLQVCEGIDTIVHLAANTGVESSVKNPHLDLNSNVIGTFNMLDAARANQVNKFIFASSGAPLGEVKPPIHEGKVPRPVSPYGASKLAGEAYCSAYYRTFGLKTVVLRFGNVYGPLSGHKDSVVAKFIKNAFVNKTLEIYGDGNQTRDFIYIDDLLQAIILSTEKDIGGEVFQIASQRETTVNEITKMLVTIVTVKTGKAVDVSYTEERLGDVKRNYSDISKAKKILGWNPKWNINDGLSATVEWYMKNHFVMSEPKTVTGEQLS